jgi:hypothetical protein
MLDQREFWSIDQYDMDPLVKEARERIKDV